MLQAREHDLTCLPRAPLARLLLHTGNARWTIAVHVDGASAAYETIVRPRITSMHAAAAKKAKDSSQWDGEAGEQLIQNIVTALADGNPLSQKYWTQAWTQASQGEDTQSRRAQAVYEVQQATFRASLMGKEVGEAEGTLAMSTVTVNSSVRDRLLKALASFSCTRPTCGTRHCRAACSRALSLTHTHTPLQIESPTARSKCLQHAQQFAQSSSTTRVEWLTCELLMSMIMCPIPDTASSAGWPPRQDIVSLSRPAAPGLDEWDRVKKVRLLTTTLATLLEGGLQCIDGTTGDPDAKITTLMCMKLQEMETRKERGDASADDMTVLDNLRRHANERGARSNTAPCGPLADNLVQKTILAAVLELHDKDASRQQGEAGSQLIAERIAARIAVTSPQYSATLQSFLRGTVLPAMATQVMKVRDLSEDELPLPYDDTMAFSAALGANNRGFPGITCKSLIWEFLKGEKLVNGQEDAITALARHLGRERSANPGEEQQQRVNALIAMHKTAYDINAAARLRATAQTPAHDDALARLGFSPQAELEVCGVVARTDLYVRACALLMDQDELLRRLRAALDELPQGGHLLMPDGATAEQAQACRKARRALLDKVLPILHEPQFDELGATLRTLLEFADTDMVVYGQLAANKQPCLKLSTAWQKEFVGIVGPALAALSSEGTRGDLGMCLGTISDFHRRGMMSKKLGGPSLQPLLQYTALTGANVAVGDGHVLELDEVWVMAPFKVFLVLICAKAEGPRSKQYRWTEFAW